MRYAKHLLCLLMLPALVWLGCRFSGKEDEHSTVIRGNIHLPEGSKIYLYSYANTAEKYLRIKTRVDSAMVDENGNYRFSLNWITPCVFDLRAGNSFLVPELFLRPEDKIILNFNGPRNEPEIIPATKGGKYNDYLLKSVKKFYTDTTAALFFYIVCNFMDGHQFSAYCKQRKEQMLSFYESYFKNDTPDKEFSDFALSEIKYQDAVYRIKYLIKKRTKCLKVEVDSDYYNFSNPSYVYDETALNSSSYFFFLNLYINNVYAEGLDSNGLPKNQQGKFIPSVEKFKLASACMDSLPRKVVQFNIVFNELTSAIGADHANYDKTISRGFSNKSIDSLIAWFQHHYILSKV